MKKLLLSVLGAASLMTVNAAVPPTTTSVWTNTIYSVANAEDVNYNAEMAFTADGETYAAGIVSGEGFRFCPNMVIPVGVSSYVVKYDNKGLSAWAATISGAATVTAIAVDAEKNVYVAGTLADEVIFAGADDPNEIVVAGYKDEYGSYTTDQKAAFIAKYDANGALKAVVPFVPTVLPGVAADMATAEAILGFGWYEESISFNISTLKVVDGKLYVGALYTGSTTVGDIKLDAAYQNVDGWMFADLASCSVFTLDAATLQGADVLFSTSVKGGVSSNNMSTTSVGFDVNEGVLYASAIMSGTQTIKMGTTEEEKEFTMTDEGLVEYATVVAAINTADKSLKTSKIYTQSTSNMNKDEVSKVIADGGKVYVGGVAHSALSFDNSKEVKGHGDLYVASLNANDLAVNWTALSGVEEGTGTDNGEVFVNMVSFGGNIVVAGYTEKLSDRTPIEGINAYVDKADGVFSLSSDKIVKSALEADGAWLGAAIYTITEEVANITYSVAKIEGSAIDSVEAENNATVKYYNLQGVEIAGDNMPAGLYVRKQGNKAIKVIVK